MKIYFVFVFASLMACAQNSTSDSEKTEDNASTTKVADEQSSTEVQGVTVSQFEKLRLSGSADVIDVRSPDEIAQGKVPNALEIEYNSDNFEGKLDALDRDKSYMLYCEAGGRSSKTAQLMVQKGFKNVYNLDGGYKAWEKEVSK